MSNQLLSPCGSRRWPEVFFKDDKDSTPGPVAEEVSSSSGAPSPAVEREVLSREATQAADILMLKVLATFLLGELASKQDSPKEAKIFLDNIKSKLMSVVDKSGESTHDLEIQFKNRIRRSASEIFDSITLSENSK